jgi:O-antigen/teichoic acid export membrane protein
MLVARILGVASYGLLAFGYSLSLLCLVIPGFGFSSLAIRELARRPGRASNFFSHISVIMWVLTLPMAAVCTITASGDGDGLDRLTVILVVFFFMATQQHILFICSLFRATQDVRREVFVRLLLALLWLVTGLLVLLAGFGLEPLVVSRLLAAILCLVLAFLWARKDLGISIRPFRWRYAKTLVRMSAPLALGSIFFMVFNSLNLVILGLMKGDTATGYYSASEKIVALLFIIPFSLSWAALPALSVEWQQRRSQFLSTYRRLIRYMVILSVPLTVGSLLVGEELLILLFGDKFSPSVPVLKILAFSLFPFFLSQVSNTVLISMNRQGMAVGALVTASIVTVISSLLLIPGYGVIGAGISRIVAVCSLFTFELAALQKGTFSTETLHTIARSLLGGLIMGLGIHMLKGLGVGLGILIPAGVAIFFGVLIMVREIRIGEIRQAIILIRDIGRTIIGKR